MFINREMLKSLKMNGNANITGPMAPTTVRESGVLFSPKFAGMIDKAHIHSDYEGHILYILISKDSDIKLINVYAPNVSTDRGRFFDSLPEYIKGHTPLIVGGDCNCVKNILLDKFGVD